MKKRLELLLCPQEYEGMTMQVTECDCCSVGWNKKLGICQVTTGSEHLPDSPNVPTCPMQEVCQHQVQSKSGPCSVRRKGLVCESALVYGGMTEAEAMSSPLGFNATCVISEEDLAFEENAAS